MSQPRDIRAVDSFGRLVLKYLASVLFKERAKLISHIALPSKFIESPTRVLFVRSYFFPFELSYCLSDTNGNLPYRLRLACKWAYIA